MSILNVGGTEAWMANTIQIGGQKTLDQLIKSLFADGTQGIYLNAQDAVSVSDLSSIKDLSGRNNHATQVNATSRASLITDPSGYKSLKFDGIDDGYVTPSINFSNTDKVTVIAAVRKLSDATQGLVTELSTNIYTYNGTFNMLAPAGTDTANRYRFAVKGTLLTTKYTSTTSEVGDTAVMRGVADVSNGKAGFYLNGIMQGSNDSNLGTGNYGNYPLYIGRKGGTSLPFNGQIYALLVIGKLLDDATTQRIEKEFAKYIGVTL